MIRLKDSDSYEYLKGMIDLDNQPKDASTEELEAHPFVVVGDPDHCIEKLEAVEVLGMDQIITFQQMGAIPHERIMQSIRLFGDEIISHFRNKAAPADVKAVSAG